MKILTEGTLPLSLAPLSQIGLKVALGMTGLPSNRIIMIYGDPGAGKSSLLFQLMGEYLRNGDDVEFYETEQALDRVYLSSYLPAPEEEDALQPAALKAWKQATQKLLKTPELFSPDQVKIMSQRIETIEDILKEGNADSYKTKLVLRNAIAEYKLRHIRISHPGSLEEFEKDILNVLKKREETPEKRHKRLLVGVDSLSYLLPKEDVEKDLSSDGRNFMTAKYLHTLMPRLLGHIRDREVTIIFIVQQTTRIRMMYEPSGGPIGNVQGKGGTAIKFGATFMIGVEQRAKTLNIEGNEVKTGRLSIPKAKLRMGGCGPNENTFFLTEEPHKESKLDFNEPFLLSLMNEGTFGIIKRRGTFSLPKSLVEDLEPEFEQTPGITIVQPEDSGEAEEPHIQGYAKDLLPLLVRSKTFEQHIIEHYDLTTPV